MEISQKGMYHAYLIIDSRRVKIPKQAQNEGKFDPRPVNFHFIPFPCSADQFLVRRVRRGRAITMILFIAYFSLVLLVIVRFDTQLRSFV